jgi:hypothetical protein
MRSTAVPCEFEDGRAIETSSTFNLVDISSGKHVRNGENVCVYRTESYSQDINRPMVLVKY